MIERPDSFTPSNNSPEFLEEIFVQRHKLLNKAVAWSKDSIFSKQKKHLLFIGPRGSGKTHLISMIINRLETQAESHTELQDKMLIVWLGEDDIITNFLDLMSSILITLVQTYPDQFHDNSLQSTGALDIDAKAEQIIHSINEQLGDRTIVLVKENLSDVFRGLKDTGQKKFRSFLQEQRNMLVLASSQQLFDGIASRDAAFFGFFDTHHLKPLDLEEAMKLVTKLTEQKGDQKLLAFLKTPQGYFRMRALHYLAGGNHRLYISLLDFLTMESFDDLVIALQDLVIDLTPYFQERIRSLPPQQGKIIQKMCAIQGAVPVKELAAQAMIDERGTAKQLGELARKKYVLSHKRGKQSYYEVAEPLMRLSLEVKNSRGKPLKILVLLLRAWFSDNELQTKENNAEKNSDNRLFSLYKSSALQADKKMLREMHSEILKEMHMGITSNDDKAVIKSCSETLNAPLVCGEFKIEKIIALFNRGNAYVRQGEAEKAIQDFSTLINLEGAPIEQKALALLMRGLTYGLQGEAEKAIQDFSTLIDLEGAPIEQKAKALLYRGLTYGWQGAAEKTIQDCNTLLNLENIPLDIKNKVQFTIPEIYFTSLDREKAHTALETAFSQGNKKAEAYPSNITDILISIINLGSSFWQKEIGWLLLLFKEYGVLEHLGTALMKSISAFVKDSSLSSSLKKWQLLWQEAGKDYEEIKIPLQAIEAMRLSIEQKTDKPLLGLAKEVRGLVQPLIADMIK